MKELEKLNLLQTRLRALEMQRPRPSERSIVAAACEAIRDEIGELGRRLMREHYWRPMPVVPHDSGAQRTAANHRRGGNGAILARLRSDGSWLVALPSALRQLQEARRPELS